MFASETERAPLNQVVSEPLCAKIRLVRKSLPKSNPLAYYSKVTIMSKNIMARANVIKLFVTDEATTKLDCRFLIYFIRQV